MGFFIVIVSAYLFLHRFIPLQKLEKLQQNCHKIKTTIKELPYSLGVVDVNFFRYFRTIFFSFSLSLFL